MYEFLGLGRSTTGFIEYCNKDDSIIVTWSIYFKGTSPDATPDILQY